jgi:ribosomal protein S14
MTIDLTGPVPKVVHTCDECTRQSELYRLIGTTIALCRSCFARKHG